MVYFLKELHNLSVACANVLLTRSFVNLGIGIGTGIGTDITNVIIFSSIRPMDPDLAGWPTPST